MANYYPGLGVTGEQYSGPVNGSDMLGLRQSAPYQFGPPASIRANERPIDFLRPGSPQHAFVLDYLLQRLRWSEQKMQQFYPRWQANEMRLQAYVTLPKYEEMMRKTRDEGRPQAPDEIVVPYAWSTLQVIITYLVHVFGGRKPMFQVGAYRGEQVQRAQSMEMLLQYNNDYVKMIYKLAQYFMNGELYGVAIQRTAWSRVIRPRSVIRNADPQLAALMSLQGMPPAQMRTTEMAVNFEGNDSAIINPFMFFPDPRVPMNEVAEKGEFVFWRSFDGRHLLMRAEADGSLKWVKYAGQMPRAWASGQGSSQSNAGLRAFGDSLTDGSVAGDSNYAVGNNVQVDQGSVEIVPSELGLGPGTRPEKWIFTILNKTQIVQAQPEGLNHGKHPISVSEPNTFGYSFGQLATTDLVAPVQDFMSWLINSHMYNVRASLNNLFFVNPNLVEIDDLLDPLPGGLVRLKAGPWGNTDPTQAFAQARIQDITRAHLEDMQLMQRVGADLTGATDNLRGLQDSGGRKTATEVRTTFDAGGSRLAYRAMMYSANGITQTAEQMASNYQQFLSADFEMRVLGREGAVNSVRITPQDIEGDFFFPILDGTLPLDRVAQLDVWKEIWQAVIGDPTGQMQSIYNAPAIFRFMAQLAGAQNIDEFRMTATAAPPGMMQQQAQAGNMVPLTQLQPQLAQAIAEQHRFAPQGVGMMQ